MRRTHGLFKVREVQYLTAYINENSILNRAAIDRVTPVQKQTEDAKKGQYMQQITNTDNTHTQPHNERHNKGNNDKEIKEFMVGRAMHDVQGRQRMQYVVCWYIYGLQDDTVKQSVHISKHFTEKNWRDKRK